MSSLPTIKYSVLNSSEGAVIIAMKSEDIEIEHRFIFIKYFEMCSIFRNNRKLSKSEFAEFDLSNEWVNGWTFNNVQHDGGDTHIIYDLSTNIIRFKVLPNTGAGSMMKISATAYVRENMEIVFKELMSSLVSCNED
jgi:hypothetical protein